LSETVVSKSPDGAVRLAAIDIGSNSIRQLVGDVLPSGTIRVVDEMKAAPRLATGLATRGALSESSIELALDTLVHMSTLARQLGARRIGVVATSAVREASNASDFLERVHEKVGLHVRVLTGRDEARLSFLSALAHFDLGAGRTTVLDIGGGSIEATLSVDGLLERMISLPLGAIRLTERFLGPEPRRKHVRKLRKLVRKQIREHLPVRAWRGAQLIGSGGTFTNLAGIYLARQNALTAQTRHGTCVPRVELEHILDWLQAMSLDERRAVDGLNPERADIILAGLAAAAEVAAVLGVQGIVVSAFGIREGLLLEMARVRPVIAQPGEARERSVRELGERSHFDAKHAHQVRRLALQLFDRIGEQLGCERSDRDILADAALLHDIGYNINYTKHHKHTYHLIVHADLLGMSPPEQVMLANVARYHGGAPPRKKHRNFGILDKPTRRRIRRLAAILRVAEGLDRGHVSAVEHLRVRWTDQALRLSVYPRGSSGSVRLELWGAERRSALLAKLAGVPVQIAEATPKPASTPVSSNGRTPVARRRVSR
jgi:exopolyphosphatase/guanosine-5'-triphosphate,3'-diphosphate pyrophosphatase